MKMNFYDYMKYYYNCKDLINDQQEFGITVIST